MTAGYGYEARAARRVTGVAIGILGLAALLAAAAIFVYEERRLRRAVEGTLQGALDVRQQVLLSVVEMRIAHADAIADHPWIRHLLAARQDAKRDSQPSAGDLIGGGVSAVTVFDARGGRIAAIGKPSSEPGVVLKSESVREAEMFWAAGPVFRVRVPVADGGRMLGHVLVEQPMRILESMLSAPVGRLSTSETLLCYAQDDRIHCFPSRLSQGRPTEAPRAGSTDTSLPAARALDGGSGVMRGMDYRGEHVMAAYGPVGGLGLAMSVEADVDELTSPLRQQLPYVAVLALVALAIGAGLLHWLVRPLVHRIALAERADVALYGRRRRGATPTGWRPDLPPATMVG